MYMGYDMHSNTQYLGMFLTCTLPAFYFTELDFISHTTKPRLGGYHGLSPLRLVLSFCRGCCCWPILDTPIPMPNENTEIL